MKMTRKKRLLPGLRAVLICALFICLSGKDARAIQAIDSVIATPAEISVTVSTSVLFTAQIAADPNLITESVYLYQCDSDGSPILNLGRLYDDQTNGDVTPGDYTFSVLVTLNGENTGDTYFKVTVAYSGSRARLQSDLVIVEIIAESDSGETEEYTDTEFEAVDWTEATHSKSADPDFSEVFDDTMVKRIDFVITRERWQSMLDNMTELYGEFGQNSISDEPMPGDDELIPPGDEPIPPSDESIPPGDLPVPGDDVPVLDDDESVLIEDVEDPIFVPGEVFYNGIEWYRVGIRFKGNSSLQSSWQQGILKLPFKLDFDEFEDYYPQIDNQRFYGFKKFSLKNNYEDKSQLREKVAADVFANAGLAVSHTAFYALYIDHGDGPEYFGLYTLVEEVDDTVIDTQFSSDDGNLYKPEDGSASFIEGTFNEEDFEKKTNEDDEDWSDIEALFSALHDDSRLSAPGKWRTNLKAVFNVDDFLKYLAVSGIIQNWDSYGRMPHNFYLYNDPDTSKLTWIPWDHNETLQEGKMGGALALDFSNIEADGWPLIEKIYADTTYKKKYDTYVEKVIKNAFNTYNIQTLYDTYAALIEYYATSERDGYSFLRDPEEFYQAIEELKEHASARATAVEEYLNE
jgi:spore coat protein CotH